MYINSYSAQTCCPGVYNWMGRYYIWKRCGFGGRGGTCNYFDSARGAHVYTAVAVGGELASKPPYMPGAAIPRNSWPTTGAN